MKKTKNIMSKSRKKYDKRRNKIRDMENISEAERNMLFFNNWSDYIFNSVPEDTRNKNTNTHLEKMIFVRL